MKVKCISAPNAIFKRLIEQHNLGETSSERNAKVGTEPWSMTWRIKQEHESLRQMGKIAGFLTD